MKKQDMAVAAYLVAAFAMYKLELGENPVRIFILVIYGVSTIVSGLIYAKKKSEKRLLNGAMIGALYFIILSVVSFIANHGFYEDIKKAGCNALCVYLGNFGPEISETLLAKHFEGPKMFCAAAEETSKNFVNGILASVVKELDN